MRVLGRPYGPEPHNGLLYWYEVTNITEEKVVNHSKTQFIDALIEFHYRLEDLFRNPRVPHCKAGEIGRWNPAPRGSLSLIRGQILG